MYFEGQNNTKAESFLIELQKHGARSGGNGYMLFFNVDAELSYRIVDEDFIDLNSLYVSPDLRGQGIGRKIMSAVADAADKTGVSLRLRARPIGENLDSDGDETEKLVRLYASVGFRFNRLSVDEFWPDVGVEMYRNPMDKKFEYDPEKDLPYPELNSMDLKF